VRISALSGDFEALRRVIRGLVDNAIKYTPAGRSITVSARETGDLLAISVSDTGKEFPKLTCHTSSKSFYRAASEADDDPLGTAAPGVASVSISRNTSSRSWTAS
jgi:signal transduction histidine kinase